MRRRWAAVVITAIIGVLAACGGDDDTTADDTTTTTTTEPPDGPDMIGEPSTETVESDDFPGGFGDTALLRDVRVAVHDGFTRVVLDLDGDTAPSYRVGYTDPPARQPGSGFEIDIEGPELLELRLTPAAAVDLTGEEVVETYTGPDEIPVPAGGPGNEVVFGGDFEANMAWIVGLDEVAPFAMAMLDEPLRLVVDIAH